MSTASLQDRGECLSPKLPNRIPSLDGLRAVSIALVIVGHSSDSLNAPTYLNRLNHLGNFGVRCFFIISGFLITTLLLKEREKTGRISMKGFYIRRALRIFPPSIVFIGIVGLCWALGWLTLKDGDLVHAVTYTMNYHFNPSNWVRHLWSLSVEEQFYLLWPGVIGLAGSRRANTVAWGTVILVPLIRAFMWFVVHASDSAMTKHFEANADVLAIGCLLSMNFNRLGTIRWYRSFQSSKFFWVVSAGLVLVGDGIYLVSPACFYIVGQSIANLGTVICIDWCIRNLDTRVGTLLNWRPVIYVGALSYSLYLWQNIFFNHDWLAWPASFPINLIFACGIALMSYYLIEKPFLKLRRFA